MDEREERRSSIRRTAIILVAVAATFYFGFILISVLRG